MTHLLIVVALSSLLFLLLWLHAEHAYIDKLQEALDASQAYIDELENASLAMARHRELQEQQAANARVLADRSKWPVERRPSRRGWDGDGPPAAKEDQS